ncbi:7854_t:CDS:1, partial [Funneliformis geosporum]
PAVKDIDVDINIHNTKLIYIKYKHEKFEDPGTCLKREIIFSEDETVLTLELPN